MNYTVTYHGGDGEPQYATFASEEEANTCAGMAEDPNYGGYHGVSVAPSYAYPTHLDALVWYFDD